MIHSESTWVKGFAPLISDDSQVLILGSMPGVASLKAQAYYAHPRNAFWPIMSQLFEIDSKASYDQRTTALQENGVALWDVLSACERQGSLDSAIQTHSEQVNDFESLFFRYPKIRAVFCNGGKAWQSYQRYVCKPMKLDSLDAYALPSTSPAYASLNFDAKLSAWKAVAEILNKH